MKPMSRLAARARFGVAAAGGHTAGRSPAFGLHSCAPSHIHEARKVDSRGTFAVAERNSCNGTVCCFGEEGMTVINWFDILLFGTPLIWLLVKFGMRWTASPEDIGCVLLKQKAASLGVDVNGIPEPAWHAIVEMSIASAKDRAMCSRLAVNHASRYWQANLVGTLEEEAQEISKFVKGSPCSRHSVAPHILTEYRV
jgi:hypothetical protein